jgi:hypothetical protein
MTRHEGRPVPAGSAAVAAGTEASRALIAAKRRGCGRPQARGLVGLKCLRMRVTVPGNPTLKSSSPGRASVPPVQKLHAVAEHITASLCDDRYAGWDPVQVLQDLLYGMSDPIVDEHT